MQLSALVLPSKESLQSINSSPIVPSNSAHTLPGHLRNYMYNEEDNVHMIAERSYLRWSWLGGEQGPTG